MNKQFTSAQREGLIQKAVESSKKKNSLCPFNNGSGCEIYEKRPVRCRIYGTPEVSTHKEEIKHILFELSQAVFLALSGKFLQDTGFTFSVADTISGKFVQRYFHYMADIEKTKIP
jgi:Fe-S-cluster containining protein